MDCGNTIVQSIIKQVKNDFLDFKTCVIKQDSHVIIEGIVTKYSLHIIIRLYLTIKNLSLKMIYKLNEFVLTFGFDAIDTVVYREKGGLFRTILSSKPGENSPRILDEFISDIIHSKDKGVTPLDVSLVDEGTFSEKASPLCVVSNAATHTVSRTGYTMDTVNNERISFGSDFKLYSFFKDCNITYKS